MQSLDDLEVAGRRVLLRSDLNVPLDLTGTGEITDDGRIRASLPVISKLSDRQGEQVRVFTIAYGQDADQAVLRQIAESTDGAEYDSSNPNGIREVLTEVVSNF